MTILFQRFPLVLSILISVFLICATAPGIAPLPLQGHNLTCCAFLSHPFLTSSSNRKPYGLDGPSIDFLEKLQAQLGFRCSTMHLFSPDEISSTKVIHQLGKCRRNPQTSHLKICGCQLCLGWFILTTQTIHRAHYVPYYMRDQLIAIAALNKRRQSFFYDVFQPGVWGFIVVFLVSVAIIDAFACFAYGEIEEVFPMPDDRYSAVRIARSLFNTVGTAVYKLYCTFVGNGQEDGGITRIRLFLVALVWTVGLFLAHCYGALLPASLDDDTLPAGYSVVKEMENCQLPVGSICGVAGPLLAQAMRGILPEVKCPGHEQESPIFSTSVDEGVKNLLSGRCKILVLSRSNAMPVLAGPLCSQLQVAGQPLLTEGGSFIFPPRANFRVVQAFESAAMYLRGQGFVEKAQSYFSGSKCSKRVSRQLSLDDLRLVIITISIILASLAGTLVYICIRREIRRRASEEAEAANKREESEESRS